ncbi:ubiquinol-cytochrome C reductase [Vibrio sp. 10N.286.49.C2]|uniref:ABC1 kinase family protein n=1 Tax=unclassified Vibrio TaxID=2614977 RepID=UPI000C838053|nr:MULTISPECIES: AarF/ABC1/UbiB kinase family protein [unclassified Vibrio]PMH43346.1 ubiquinol-cytochrome C reductase [Vibrio sp. 10N.286.49.C2]PMH56998.1 ubiquinol-cytochrome C reductase [Vibrio sp. 10N.286.49.B1]PMH79134.1 ubiquinol-cytochrome C reductase [Vibrio sp. 10N.286.48.B7]
MAYNESKVPTSRLTRFGKLASLATRVTGAMVTEGAKQFAQGKRPTKKDLLLTPNNVKRVADQLAHLRGAAMKVGQLMSMDAGDLISPELAQILARLRSDGSPMPSKQLANVMSQELGPDWKSHFIEFNFKPIASASIGQVHQAHSEEGTKLAIKVQYPGIKTSIDSDVDNVGTLLNVVGLIPKGVNYQGLLEEAKLQLHAEADYLLEASLLNRYRTHLDGSDDFILPMVLPDITTDSVLAMTYVSGDPIESLINADQETRNRVVHLLLSLLFKEIFEFKLVQTDPNFANFLYNAAEKKVVLLDFGATRSYNEQISQGYQLAFSAILNNDNDALGLALTQIGFFNQDILPDQKAAIFDLVRLACEPLKQIGPYNFGSSNLAQRLSDAGTVLSMEKDYWHTPPADALFLHRKIGGLYLLAARLNASVNVHQLFQPYQQTVVIN